MTENDGQDRASQALRASVDLDAARGVENYLVAGRRHEALSPDALLTAYIDHTSRVFAAVKLRAPLRPHLGEMMDVLSELELRGDQLPQCVQDWTTELAREHPIVVADTGQVAFAMDLVRRMEKHTAPPHP